MEKAPCRLVLHELPGGNSHLDLFIYPPGARELATFEISGPAMELFLRLAPPTGPVQLESGLERVRVAPPGIPARRKNDHRLFYWEHEGEVSGGRGRIREVFTGEIRGDFRGAELLLFFA